MALVNTYYQASEPADLTPGTVWIDSVGSRKQRGIDGAWRSMGNVNLDNGGSVKRAGDSMDGALQGAHGLASLTDPNFHSTVRLDSDDLSPKSWVNTKLSDLNTSLLEKIAAIARGGNSASASLLANIAFGYGCNAPAVVVGGSDELANPTDPHRALNHGNAVPLPSYINPDGSRTPASLSEIVMLMVSPRNLFDWNNNDEREHRMLCSVDPTTLIVTARVNLFRSGEAVGTYAGAANYIIVCVRS